MAHANVDSHACVIKQQRRIIPQTTFSSFEENDVKEITETLGGRVKYCLGQKVGLF